MKSYEYDEAFAHMLRTFKNTWSDSSVGWASIEGLDEEPKIEWPNLDGKRDLPEVDTTPSELEPWLRVFVKHHDSDQASMGETGGRVFTRTGMIGVDIFVPLNIGLKLQYRLGTVCKRPFEGKRGFGDGCGIVFRSVRLREHENNQKRWAHATVYADFEYDEVL